MRSESVLGQKRFNNLQSKPANLYVHQTGLDFHVPNFLKLDLKTSFM